ncbi:MAG: anti-sigma factor [Actinomycetota bacterium]|jgi:anti-sigma-K factor RskA|nr:anti-sigma factor [Actinomycetota bacterium]
MSDAERGRFDELLDAYALGALSDEERREFEKNLTEHPQRQAEVDDLVAVAGLMALAPVELEPSSGLRKRLMRTVRASGAASEPTRRPLFNRLRDLFGYQALAAGAAAVALIGLLSWNVLLQGELQNFRSQPTVDAEPRVLEFQAVESAGSASGELIVLEGQQGVLVAKDMPRIKEGQVWQIWVIEGDEPKPGGLFQPDQEDPVAASMTRSPGEGDIVAITVEPAGGSSAPTSDPIMTTQL